eukprot:TRINITY_DN24891_c0_g1_i1.p1 TRINITY_DN24891_c0_g1~~TRINITY_DN24891_c0_g1_i1.p1  ORF type:complete len:239 (+),score=78.94 TRINITY_DN24891_c0_g1_i1:80-796(+)
MAVKQKAIQSLRGWIDLLRRDPDGLLERARPLGHAERTQLPEFAQLHAQEMAAMGVTSPAVYQSMLAPLLADAEVQQLLREVWQLLPPARDSPFWEMYEAERKQKRSSSGGPGSGRPLRAAALDSMKAWLDLLHSSPELVQRAAPLSHAEREQLPEFAALVRQEMEAFGISDPDVFRSTLAPLLADADIQGLLKQTWAVLPPAEDSPFRPMYDACAEQCKQLAELSTRGSGDLSRRKA